MLKGRMPRRWPMMSREDSSVLELSIYSEASSSSGDEDDDDLASEWSEWEDPLWVKDDNLRRPAARCDSRTARSPLTPRSAAEAGSCSGLRKSSTIGGSGSSQLIVRKLSALAIAQQVVVKSPASTTSKNSDSPSGSLSLSISLSFEGQESGTGSPLATPSSSSASTPSWSRLSLAASSSASTHLRVPRKVTELVAQDEADEAWSLSAGTLPFKSISDVDQHVDTILEDDDHHTQEWAGGQARQATVAPAGANDNNESDYDDQMEADGVDDGSVEEEVEAELSSDQGGTSEDEYDEDEGDKDDVEEEEEEKGIEYLLRKYFPESLAAIEQDSPPPDPTKEKKKKKKKKSKHKKKKRDHKEKREGKEEKRTKSERSLAHGRGQAPITRINHSEDEAAPPSAANRLVFSVDEVVLERRDKAREKYQSLFIPSLDLRRSAGADPENSDAERKPSSAGGRRRVRHRSERERRMPQSAREGFGRKSARELGMIFRCRSREDVTDDERNVIDADAEAVASPRTRRARSRTSESVVPPPSAAPASPRAKAKHSWVIKREDSVHPRPPAHSGNEIGREHLGQVYGRLSVSTSSFAVAADSSSPSPSTFSASGVLSPLKKTGSFRSLLSGRRAAAGEAHQHRDAISAEHPTLASSSSSSSSSSLSWSSKSALPSIHATPTSLSSPPSATTSSSPSPSSPPVMRRGRSSSLNKAAGLFKRSGSLRTARDKQVVSADDNSGGGLAGGDSRSRSASAGGDQQAQQKEKKEKVVGGFKKSWREMKSYFASDREVKTYFNGSASMPATLES